MLPDYTHLCFFLTATILLNLAPGNDVLYVAGQSLQSKKHGIMATFGISTGICIYILATTLGLTSVLHHSPVVFNVIKIVGAAYLLYLAWQMLTKPSNELTIQSNEKSFGFEAYYKGTLTTLLNPKVGLFFITFLPQFVDVSRGKAWLQLLSLGGCFILSGTIVNLLYVFLFSHLKLRLFSKTTIQKWFNKVTALLFCAIAFKVLTTKQS